MVFVKWPTWHDCQLWVDEATEKMYYYDMSQWLEYTQSSEDNGKTYWPTWKTVDWDDEMWVYDTDKPTDLFVWESGDKVSYVFKNYDGTVLKEGKVKEGTAPTPPANPIRPATSETAYIFAGWNPTVAPITKKTTYTATYNEIPSSCVSFTVSPDEGWFVCDMSWNHISELYVPTWATVQSSLRNRVQFLYNDDIVAQVYPEETTFYEFSTWGTLPATVSEDLTITATFNDISSYSYDNWYDWEQLREEIRDQLPEWINVMMMSGAKKVRTAGQTSTDIGWLWGWEWFGDWEVFVAVLSNANVDVLWIVVKTEEEVGWHAALNQLRNAFEMPDSKMTDAIWNQVMWWFSTTLTVTTSWWETTISDGSQSIIIDTTSHDMRYGADYYDWTDDTATEYALCNTNWWLVDGTYQYETSDQETTDWNNLVTSIKAKWIVNATITHDTVNGEITMANGQWSMTIMDKNLWASVVYEDWDTLSEANCGTYFQRWNNNWFAWTGSVTTSGTQVDTTGYGPWNYYTWTDFIIWSPDWSNPSNDNLWGDTTDTEQARQWPAPSGYHVPSTTEWQNFIKFFNTIRPNAHSSNDFKTAFLIPFAGGRNNSNASPSSQGSFGGYWSSSPNPSNTNDSYYLYFTSSNIYTQYDNSRATGFSVRCFKDSTPPL